MTGLIHSSVFFLLIITSHSTHISAAQTNTSSFKVDELQQHHNILSGVTASWFPPISGVLDTARLDEALRSIQDLLERLDLSFVLRILQGSVR